MLILICVIASQHHSIQYIVRGLLVTSVLWTCVNVVQCCVFIRDNDPTYCRLQTLRTRVRRVVEHVECVEQGVIQIANLCILIINNNQYLSYMKFQKRKNFNFTKYLSPEKSFSSIITKHPHPQSNHPHLSFSLTSTEENQHPYS